MKFCQKAVYHVYLELSSSEYEFSTEQVDGNLIRVGSTCEMFHEKVDIPSEVEVFYKFSKN